MTSREPRTITMTATELRRQFASVIDQIQAQGLRVIVTVKGGTQAVLVPLDFDPQLKLARQVTVQHGHPLVAVISYQRYTDILDLQAPDHFGVPGWVSIQEAAKRLRLARTTILHRIKQGQLEARRLTDHPRQPWIVRLP